MRAIVRLLAHSLVSPSFGRGRKAAFFQFSGHILVLQILFILFCSLYLKMKQTTCLEYVVKYPFFPVHLVSDNPIRSTSCLSNPSLIYEVSLFHCPEIPCSKLQRGLPEVTSNYNIPVISLGLSAPTRPDGFSVTASLMPRMELMFLSSPVTLEKPPGLRGPYPVSYLYYIMYIHHNRFFLASSRQWFAVTLNHGIV